MKQVGKFKLYPLDEVLDEALGPIGTAERDEHERLVADAINKICKHDKVLN